MIANNFEDISTKNGILGEEVDNIKSIMIYFQKN